MRRAIWTAAVTILSAFAMVNAHAEGGKKDKELLQGAWETVGMSVGGKGMPKELFQDQIMIFKGDKIISKSKGQPDDESDYTIDDSKNPKQIDVIAKLKGKVRGIYELKGDTLKIAIFDKETDQRPTSFAGTDPAEVLFTMKKKK
jgi:uncharacterized protein (TIGR03067 family)